MILNDILKAIWHLLEEMAPYLLFGFFIAGILNLLIPREKIYSHLSGNKFSGIVKAALFGVPLPLCSCGVIPVAAYLRKEGAGKGATISFLSSTPTTGVDSIFATYSLLGPLFAVVRIAAAFVAGIFGGYFVGLLDKDEEEKQIEVKNRACVICNDYTEHSHSFIEKIVYIFKYGFGELISDVAKWLLVGIVVGGVLSAAVPHEFIKQYLGNPWLAYPLMLLISIPLYICATGSIPIAAALIAGGMAPGAGLIFLIAGPATNTATLAFVSGKMGKKTLFIYLGSIIITAVGFALAVDLIWFKAAGSLSVMKGDMDMLPGWLKLGSALLFSLLVLRVLVVKLIHRIKNGTKEKGMRANYEVEGMSCMHCVGTIESSLKKIPGIDKMVVSLKDNLIQLNGDYDEKEVLDPIKKAGYGLKKKD